MKTQTQNIDFNSKVEQVYKALLPKFNKNDNLESAFQDVILRILNEADSKADKSVESLQKIIVVMTKQKERDNKKVLRKFVFDNEVMSLDDDETSFIESLPDSKTESKDNRLSVIHSKLLSYIKNPVLQYIYRYRYMSGNDQKTFEKIADDLKISVITAKRQDKELQKLLSNQKTALFSEIQELQKAVIDTDFTDLSEVYHGLFRKATGKVNSKVKENFSRLGRLRSFINSFKKPCESAKTIRLKPLPEEVKKQAKIEKQKSLEKQYLESKMGCAYPDETKKIRELRKPNNPLGITAKMTFQNTESEDHGAWDYGKTESGNHHVLHDTDITIIRRNKHNECCLMAEVRVNALVKPDKHKFKPVVKIAKKALTEQEKAIRDRRIAESKSKDHALLYYNTGCFPA